MYVRLSSLTQAQISFFGAVSVVLGAEIVKRHLFRLIALMSAWKG